MDTPARHKVCIIGGGVSGLATAYLLAQDGGHDVVLVEQDERLGGAAHTMDVVIPADGDFEEERRWVDMGVNDFNASTYTRLVGVMNDLGITEWTDPASDEGGYGRLIDEESFFTADGSYVYTAGAAHADIPPQINEDLNYFKAHAQQDAGLDPNPKDPDDGWARDMTVEQYLTTPHKKHAYSTDFAEKCIYPRVNAMYFSTDSHPATIPFVAVMQYYGLQEGFGSGAAPRRMFWRNGTRHWIDTLTRAVAAEKHVRILTKTAATVTGAYGGRPVVQLENVHEPQIFDAVVFAGHATSATASISNLTPEQADVLEHFTYLPSTAYAHTFAGVLPAREFWRTYNILIREPSLQPIAESTTPYSISYLVNDHQNDKKFNPGPHRPFFCSLTPFEDIPSECILLQPDGAQAKADFPHNVLNEKAIKGQGELWGSAWEKPALALEPSEELPEPDTWGIQGDRGIFFTGGWTLGAGLHEQCWQSADRIRLLLHTWMSHPSRAAAQGEPPA